MRVRRLGQVSYDEANVLQHALCARATDDYLLLLEHPHVYTLGVRAAAREHVLVDPSEVGAELVATDRGGDVTYHGPGQLIGYPIVSLPEWRGGMRDVVAYVRALEDVLIAALGDLGIAALRTDGLTGVWVGQEKIAAIGVKVSRGRTLHGFALNVHPDLAMFSHIVPCGIADRGVTSVERVLGRRLEMSEVVGIVAHRFAERFADGPVERQDVTFPRTSYADESGPFGVQVSSNASPADGLARGARPSVTRDDPGGLTALPDARGPQPVRLLGRLAQAGVTVGGVEPGYRRPPWMKVRADLGTGYRETKQMVRELNLHTVCEEAGCPNIYECWSDRTATLMILGEQCTRACGFCLVDTRKPLAVDEKEPVRAAEAVARMDLAHAVITSVARDDLPDGGAGVFAATIRAIRERCPQTTVEVLIPDCKGDAESLSTIFDARPDVLNHNLETVARLQRAARPSAGYARSLGVLARAKDAGLVTKSGIILGMGETADEIRGAIADLRGVGVDILTIGQYLRPSDMHLPVVRWWNPREFDELGEYARSLGFSHVESGPLVRSSYHARRAVERVPV